MSIQTSQAIFNINKYYKGSILIIDFLKHSNDFINNFIIKKFDYVAILLEDKVPKNDLSQYRSNIRLIRNGILSTTPKGIIVHDGTGEIDNFKPMKIIEVNYLHKYS